MRRNHDEWVRRILGVKEDEEIHPDIIETIETCEELTRSHRSPRDLSWECLEVLLTPFAVVGTAAAEKPSSKGKLALVGKG